MIIYKQLQIYVYRNQVYNSKQLWSIESSQTDVFMWIREYIYT